MTIADVLIICLSVVIGLTAIVASQHDWAEEWRGVDDDTKKKGNSATGGATRRKV